MNRIEQSATSVIVNHNPDLEKCGMEECEEILFGPCIVAKMKEIGPKGEKTKEWILCSPQCYVKFDQWFEEVYLLWAGEDHIATIDFGMPDEWAPRGD